MFHKLYPLLWRNSTRVFFNSACSENTVRTMVTWRWRKIRSLFDYGRKVAAFRQKRTRTMSAQRKGNVDIYISMHVTENLWNILYLLEWQGGSAHWNCYTFNVIKCRDQRASRGVSGRQSTEVEKNNKNKKIINQPITFWDWLYAYRFKPNFE